MRQPRTKTKPRKTTLASFPVPTAGLISNRNLALPTGQGVPPGAAILENWFPTPSTIRLRRGLQRRATIDDEKPVKSLFTYVLGEQQQLFAATDDGIYDVTASDDPAPILTGTTNGDWVTLQFSTTGGTYVIGVNGSDTGFIYDGTSFWPYITGGIWSMAVTTSPDFVPGEVVTGGTSGATATVWAVETGILYLRDKTGDFEAAEAITGSIAGAGTVDSVAVVAAPGPEGMDPADMSYVWAYKQRIWFIGKNTLNAWYLPVDQVGGVAEAFPLGGVFNRGGSLLFGQNWSLDSGGDGGLSEQNVFCTTQGEVAAYQGLSPDSAETWGKVGVYRIGVPLGKKAFIRAGGDLVIATSIGFIPLGQAIQRDYAALGTIAISQPIADEWRNAVTLRGMTDWHCELWGEGGMVLVAPPTPSDMAPVVFVTNSDSAAWATFTGWRPVSMEVFRGALILGSIEGKVQNAWVGGKDEDLPYTGIAMPLFNDMGGPGQRKFAEFARAVLRSTIGVVEKIAARFDWDMSVPAAPAGVVPAVQSLWDLGEWDSSVWNEAALVNIQDQWRSVGGTGYAATVVLQVTSGADIPADVELVRLDYTYSQGDIVT